MTGTPSLLADLLTDCEAHGIRLLLAGDDKLTIDAPRDALTPELLSRLKLHKAQLLVLLDQRAAMSKAMVTLVPLIALAVDPDERLAIEWVENGPPAEVDAAYRQAVDEWEVLTGQANGPNFPTLNSAPFDVPPGEAGVVDVPSVSPAADPANEAVGCDPSDAARRVPELQHDARAARAARVDDLPLLDQSAHCQR